MKRLLLPILLGLLWCVPTWAQVATVGTPTTGQTAFGAPATSVTFAYTVPAGSNTMLYVGCLLYNEATNVISGVTYNSVSMTRSGTAIRANTTQYVTLFQLVAPSTGANNVVVTADNSSNFQCGAASFTGVDQTTPTAQYATATAFFSDISQAITCTSSDMAVDFVYYGAAGNPTVGGSQTILWQPVGNNTGWGASYQQATNPTMAWTTNANSGAWAGMCVKAAAAGGATPHNLGLLGVGQ
jgi:hypothetical protein